MDDDHSRSSWSISALVEAMHGERDAAASELLERFAREADRTALFALRDALAARALRMENER
ncbi:hypothetical protein ACFYZ9_18235 [Streptomyces sp. NPDC001691]|uniref:hypothetical protein n=1 Tax=unclassified Streptomyces TaxID=2593676 RepID=UPI000DE8C458|nr:hypothetical protein [Streptomyces sp. SDr-06]RCH67744.1 hypothetical protein DT019_15970 [Streptomyces sp. SDr-06]